MKSKRVDNVVGLLNGSFSYYTRTATRVSSSFQVVGSVKHKARMTLRINVPPFRVPHIVEGISDPFRSHAPGEIIVLRGMGGSGKI